MATGDTDGHICTVAHVHLEGLDKLQEGRGWPGNYFFSSCFTCQDAKGSINICSLAGLQVVGDEAEPQEYIRLPEPEGSQKECVSLFGKWIN